MGLTKEQMQAIRNKTTKKPFEPLQEDKAQKIIKALNKVKAAYEKQEGDKKLPLYEFIEVAYDYENKEDAKAPVQHPHILNIRVISKDEDGNKVRTTLARVNITSRPQVKLVGDKFEVLKGEDGKTLTITEEQAASYWEKPVNQAGTLPRKQAFLFNVLNNPEIFVKHISAVPPKQKGKNEAKPVMWNTGMDKFNAELKENYLKNKETKEVEIEEVKLDEVELD